MLHMNIWLEIEYGDVEVEVYPCGSRVKHQIVSIARDRRFEKKLEKLAGKKIENHSCIRLLFCDGAELALEISGNQMIIGSSIALEQPNNAANAQEKVAEY